MKKSISVVSLFGFVLILFGSACCTKPPEELVNAQSAYKAAESACAADYVKGELDEAKAMLDKAEAFYADKKCRDSKKTSVDAIALAKKAEQDAGAEKEKAKAAAEKALQDATMCIDKAKAAEAETYAGAKLKSGIAMLKEAKSLFASDECKYYKVKEMAEKGHAMIKDAMAAAIAEKKRIEEEKRRKEEEARRAAEEELKRHPKSWTVVKGECLWKIAGYEAIYSDPFKWPVIYKANKAQIKDPDLIYPGQVFDIPRNVSDEEFEAAIKEAKNRTWPVENFLFDGQ